MGALVAGGWVVEATGAYDHQAFLEWAAAEGIRLLTDAEIAHRSGDDYCI